MNSKYLFFSFLWLCNLSFSQNYIYKEFGINDGLPSLQVYHLNQDKNGLIWFATDRGLASYNGYEIKTYGRKEGVLNLEVLDLYPQKGDTIYCATFHNQLFYFNEKFDGFIPYKYNNILKQELEFTQHINSLYLDEKGALHISGEQMHGKLIISKDGNILERPEIIVPNGKLDYWLKIEIKEDNRIFYYCTADSTLTNKNVVKFNIDGLDHNEVIGLQNNSRMVIKEEHAIYIVAKDGTIIKKIKTDKSPIALRKIDETHFFAGYLYDGAYIYDIEGNIIKHFLDDKSISDFLIDSEGGYWFSSLYSGVFYSKEPKIKFIPTTINAPINSLAKNKNNELYIGYSTGDILKLDKKSQLSIEYKSNANLKALIEYDAVNDYTYFYSGNALYRTGKDNVKEHLEESIKMAHVLKLSEPTKEGLLVSQHSFFTIVRNDKKNIYKKVPFRIQDACFWNDEMYLGSSSGAYLLKDNEITSLIDKDSLFENRIDDIDVNEKRKEIYFATLGAGIIIYDKKTEEVRSITKQGGLSSDIINELYIENENELWVCTNSGLNKIKFTKNNTFQITGLKSSNGLLNDGIDDVEVINDTVWIASKKGLIYAPKSLFDFQKQPRSYYFNVKACYINDSVVELQKLKNLSHEENRIEFLIEGVFLKASNELHYKYKLEGLDAKWYYTKNRKISYPALPYGNYTLKVAATTLKKNENLVFVEIPICIKPPFWKQTWFVISVIFSTLLLIYLFFKYRILSYNRHIIRELLRLLVKKIKRKEKYLSFKEAGKDIRIKTNTILYVKSSGNYIEIITENKNYTIRNKIREFIELTPDPLEYLRIHRSYIVRIDKVVEKNNKEVIINGEKLPVSNSYLKELNNLIF